MGGRGGQSSDRLSQTPSPSCTQARTSFLSHLLLSHSLSPSTAYLVDKSDQIAYFHLKELSPNKRHGSGDRIQTPNTRRSLEQMEAQCRGEERKGTGRGRGEGSGPLKTFIYVKENANVSREEWRGFRRLNLILLLLNSRADVWDWHGDHVRDFFVFVSVFFSGVCVWIVSAWGCMSLSNIV